jgi:fumarate reductase subunit D
MSDQSESDPASLHDKIDEVLTEIRVVIPGVQALLGFQFIAVLNDAFSKLQPDAKAMHFASMGLMAMAMIVLMMPAAYHRLVEHGEDTSEFFRLAGRTLLAGMALLATGLAAQFYVAVKQVTASISVSATISLAMLTLFMGLWFGYSLLKRRDSH